MLEVVRRTELQVIYIDTDDYEIALCRRSADETEVSFMEGSHRGNETNGFAKRNAIPPFAVRIEISEKSGHRLATIRFEPLQRIVYRHQRWLYGYLRIFL